MKRLVTIKRIALASTLLVVLAVALAGLWLRSRSQVITLPDGQKFRFVGVTCGTNKLPPAWLAQLIQRLPVGLVDLAPKELRSRMTVAPSWNLDRTWTFDQDAQLHVWFKRLGTNVPTNGTPLWARLADQSGVIGGVWSQASLYGNYDWYKAEFPVLPRRSRTLELILSPWVILPGESVSNPVDHLSFPNPACGKYPQWQPEPIPTVKTSGDLKVRLDKIEIGVWDGLIQHRRPPDQLRPELPETEFHFSIPFESNTNRAWQLDDAELSDATGNVLHYHPFETRGIRHDTFNGILWPGETAWRLRMNFEQTEGFTPGQLVTFTNVPIPKYGTDAILQITNVILGMRVVLEQFSYGPSANMNQAGASISIGIHDIPADVRFNLGSVHTDCGQPEKAPEYYCPTCGYYPQFSVQLKSIPTNATTMDITVAIQKLRTVEFYVKPPAP